MSVFQKIASGELPAYKIYEDDLTMAVLDRFPLVPGQVVLFTKELYPSQFTEIDPDILTRLILSAQKVAKLMEERMADVKRVIIVVEGLEVAHLHIKLFPVYNNPPYNHGVTGHLDKLEVTEAELAQLQKQILK